MPARRLIPPPAHHGRRVLTWCVAVLLPIGAAMAQTVIYVDAGAPKGGDGSSWSSAYRDLQRALDAAGPIADGGKDVQIWVAAGVYSPTRRTDKSEPSSATFMLRNRVAIYGGFLGKEKDISQRNHTVNASVLSGLTDPWHIVTARGTDESAVLDGFTIEDGMAGDGFYPGSDVGAGMVIDGASPRVSNCIFRRNAVWMFGARGGAVYIHDGEPTFIACTFELNSAEGGDGGALSSVLAAPVLVECSFDSNTATFGGGAISGDWFTATRCSFLNNAADGGGALFGGGDFRGCLFRDNQSLFGGGAAFDVGSSSFVGCRFVHNLSGVDGGAIAGGGEFSAANCWFVGNFAQGAGSAVSGGSSFTNCAFHGNVGGGSSLQLFDAAPVVTNCNFSFNEGGGLEHAGDGPAVISNSIFWFNTIQGVPSEAVQLHASGPGSIDINYSFIQGNSGAYAGEGNIGSDGSDPLFVDADGVDGVLGNDDDDLHLGAGSPCIDAGRNSFLPADVFDLDGNQDTLEALPLDGGMLARRSDDPDTQDSGDGVAPIVDMGVFELQGQVGCRADWNANGFLDSQDFFDFVRAFFTHSADFNRDGATTAQDFFDYLTAFFAGCR